MKEEEEENSIKRKVMDLVTINFSITKCPQEVHEVFTQFCREETNDNYSMGLKLLMERSSFNEQLNHIHWRLQELEESMGGESEEPPKKFKIKRMGSQNKDEELDETEED